MEKANMQTQYQEQIRALALRMPCKSVPGRLRMVVSKGLLAALHRRA